MLVCGTTTIRKSVSQSADLMYPRPFIKELFLSQFDGVIFERNDVWPARKKLSAPMIIFAIANPTAGIALPVPAAFFRLREDDLDNFFVYPSESTLGS